MIEIDLLTVDTWEGERQPIELLVGFSHPHATTLSTILVSSEILKSNNVGSLNGYQDRDRDTIVSKLQAIWETLLQQNRYIVSPTGFIKSGQSIRLLKQIFYDKLACCLAIV